MNEPKKFTATFIAEDMLNREKRALMLNAEFDNEEDIIKQLKSWIKELRKTHWSMLRIFHLRDFVQNNSEAYKIIDKCGDINTLI